MEHTRNKPVSNALHAVHRVRHVMGLLVFTVLPVVVCCILQAATNASQVALLHYLSTTTSVSSNVP